MTSLQALQRAKHLLGDPNPHHQALLLDCVKIGMGILAPFDRQLLPCVAQLWPPIVGALRSIASSLSP